MVNFNHSYLNQRVCTIALRCSFYFERSYFVLVSFEKHCTNSIYDRSMMVIQHGRLLSLSKPIAPQVLLMRLVQHSVKLMNLLRVHRFKFPTFCSYYWKIIILLNLFICILICRFVRTTPTTKLTTVINQKVHGHFQQQIMDGQYLTVLLKQ